MRFFHGRRCMASGVFVLVGVGCSPAPAPLSSAPLEVLTDCAGFYLAAAELHMRSRDDEHRSSAAILAEGFRQAGYRVAAPQRLTKGEVDNQRMKAYIRWSEAADNLDVVPINAMREQCEELATSDSAIQDASRLAREAYAKAAALNTGRSAARDRAPTPPASGLPPSAVGTTPAESQVTPRVGPQAPQ